MMLSTRAWVAARFLTFFVSWAVFQSYWGVWLAYRGFSATEIGSAVACSLLARAVTVALVYPVLTRHWTLLRLSRSVPWLIVAAAVPYFFVDGFVVLIAASIVFGLVYPLMLPLNETIATTAARRGLLPYGPTRALGSVGFIAGTLLAGWLVSGLGPGILSWALIVGCALMAVIGFFRPRDAEVLDTAGSGMGGFSVLARDRGFVASLSIAVLVQGSHAAYYSFGALRANEVASPAAVPVLLVIAPVSEFVLFSLARSRFEDLGVRTLFVIGSVSAVGRWSILAAADSWMPIALSQLLHAGSYATTHLAFSMYVRDRVGTEHHPAAQGLYASLAMGLGTAILTAVAGLQITHGIAPAMISMAIVAGAALVLIPLIRSERSTRA